MEISDGTNKDAATVGVQPASDANADFYETTNLVRGYAGGDLRPVEEVIFDRYRDDFSGRVLEVGCGAGRLVGHMGDRASEVHGIDISPAMVAYCRRTYPSATFSQMDMRAVGDAVQGPFDLLFASFNVIDAVDHADRRRTLDGFRRSLARGGLLVMSSHNLAFAPRVLGPAAEVVSQLRSHKLRGAAGSAARLPRRVRNRRRLRKLETAGPGYAILNDVAHDYSLLHYYISPSRQVRQLAVHGFEFIECLDLDGRRVEAGDSASECSELHYVARSQ